MYLEDIFIILILITCVSSGDSSCYYEENNFNTNCPDNLENYERYIYMSDYSEILVINNYKNIIYNPERLFSSACVQCLLCQTIARELQRMLSFYNKDLPKVIYNSEEFNNSLTTFCNVGFQNFDLREYKGIRFIEESSKSSTHVSCEVDGLWPKKLKAMCQTFMEDSGEWNLYLRWITEVQKPDFDINNFLCRSYGLFRYCRNLDIPAKAEKSRANYFYFK